MKFRHIVVLSLLMGIAALALAACSGAAAPTTAPAAAATSAPAAGAATAPAATTASAAPTTASSGAATTVTIWHGQTGAEADALAEAVQKFQTANPGVTVNMLAVPFAQLKNKFTTEASTGGGPDLLVGPKDWIGELAQAGLVSPLDSMSDQIGLSSLNPAAVNANKFQGKVWAFPESTEAMALWYNTDKVKTPPKSADELLTMAQTSGLALNSGFYQDAGILAAYGAKLFDDNQKCVLDQGTGGAAALDWLKTAKGTQGVITDSDGSKLDAAFKSGQVGMIFNGPWATGDYEKALGTGKVAVAPPITMGNGTFAPFLGTKNFFLSANSKGDPQAAAVKFLNFLSQPDTQAIFAKVGHIPSNPKTTADDPVIAEFVAQTQSSTYFPNEPEMGAVWTPGADMITKVLEGKSDAAAAVTSACKTINDANKK